MQTKKPALAGMGKILLLKVGELLKHTKEILTALASAGATLGATKLGLNDWITIVLVIFSILAICTIGSYLLAFWKSYAAQREELGKLQATVNQYSERLQEKDDRIAELSRFEQSYYEEHSMLGMMKVSVSANVSNSPSKDMSTSILKQDTSR